VSIEQTRPLPSPERTTGEAAVRTFGLELYALEASDEHGIDEVFATARRLRAGALVISADSFFVLQLAKLAALPSGTEFPRLLFYFYREFVAVGGLMSYFADLLDSYRIAGTS